ncbi:MAG: hypothetical protein AUJ52_10695 [Elusimicrobia bacterium CG1_02_63_36]|nr:MAG: hypothetical protein AUJ52_10695 [Elusimicrobia bacterium CG1_02_63_36]PJA18661.1 MAG: hypothetical protein COX66_00655 [Elusimicrobia bacterium CG_4_10_14_0_2_um_filter_63_34]PJB23405.1 MAG: hypothetical protein CO113_18370 [Elusimicrobia bacterium CG_4_9_14_3_um_filter_62_55]
MSEPQLQIPLPPGRDDEDERRGGGFFLWFDRVVGSLPFRVAFVTAVVMLVFLLARDFLRRPALGDPRLDVTRDEMAGGRVASSPSGQPEVDPDDPFGLGERPPPSLPPESSGVVGMASTEKLKHGAKAWGGLKSDDRPAERSSARLSAGNSQGDEGDPTAPGIVGREVEEASGAARRRSGAGGSGDGLGIGGMNAREHGTKSIMRGWGWKNGKGGTKVEIAQSGALDSLKAMDLAMKGAAGRRAESAGSVHKKMWEAASYTNWKLATKTSVGESSVRDYKIGRRTRPDPIVDEGEGGPLATAAAVKREKELKGSGRTFTTDETPEEEYAPETSGGLLPLASSVLLNSTGLNASDLPPDAAGAAALGNAQAGNLLGLSGVGMMATGQTVQGASLAGLGALLATQGGGE